MSGLRLAVLIPVLDEGPCLADAVASAWEAGADEVIVVDGGSAGGAPRLPPPTRVLCAARGRARQIDAGWRASRADVVLVLHADSLLPADAGDAVRAAISSGAVGGALNKRFLSGHPLLARVRWRTRLWWLLGFSFGDQAQFIRRDVLELMGGLNADARAEDMDLALRLQGQGRCVLLPQEVLTSARRLHEHGVLRTWALWWRIGVAQWLSSRRGASARGDGPPQPEAPAPPDQFGT